MGVLGRTMLRDPAMAAAQLGTHRLAALCLGATAMADFSDLPHGLARDFTDRDGFWEHGLAVGCLARLLGARLGAAAPGDCFLAGLFHDLGRLLALKNRPAETLRGLFLARDQGLAVHAAESRELGYGHASAGGEYLRARGLPRPALLGVFFHHFPDTCPEQDAAATALAVHLADCLAHALGLGQSGELRVPSLRETAWDAANLPTETLAAAARKGLLQFRALRKLAPARLVDGGGDDFEFY
jgi:HD-like signal output (HDOD) protein